MCPIAGFVTPEYSVTMICNTSLPFASFGSPEAFASSLRDLPMARAEWVGEAQARQRQLTKPVGSLGRLEDLAVFLAGWGHAAPPCAERITAVVFAGNHGVAARGVSAYPPEVTDQMVANYASGGAAINALARSTGISLNVVACNVSRPTGDIAVGPAMTMQDALHFLSLGARSVATEEVDVLVVGEMGIGNTTIAAALCAAALGGTGRDWTGPGTGLDPEGVARKAGIVNDAVARHRRDMPVSARCDAYDALNVLVSLGGHETAAIAGAVIAARHARIPVVMDGFVATASIAPLFAAAPTIVDHCIAAHRSAERAHGALLDILGLDPLLDLGMRLGEASGAALAAALVRAAAATHNEMATFSEAEVSTCERRD